MTNGVNGPGNPGGAGWGHMPPPNHPPSGTGSAGAPRPPSGDPNLHGAPPNWQQAQGSAGPNGGNGAGARFRTVQSEPPPSMHDMFGRHFGHTQYNGQYPNGGPQGNAYGQQFKNWFRSLSPAAKTAGMGAVAWVSGNVLDVISMPFQMSGMLTGGGSAVIGELLSVAGTLAGYGGIGAVVAGGVMWLARNRNAQGNAGPQGGMPGAPGMPPPGAPRTPPPGWPGTPPQGAPRMPPQGWPPGMPPQGAPRMPPHAPPPNAAGTNVPPPPRMPPNAPPPPNVPPYMPHQGNAGAQGSYVPPQEPPPAQTPPPISEMTPAEQLAHVRANWDAHLHLDPRTCTVQQANQAYVKLIGDIDTALAKQDGMHPLQKKQGRAALHMLAAEALHAAKAAIAKRDA